MLTDNHLVSPRLCLSPPPRPTSPELPCAVLLDRDGTLIEDRHYLADPEGVTLLDGVTEALRLLTLAGCRLFMVSNQSGVGRGLFSEQAVRACQQRLDDLLRPHGVRFTDAVWCPHAPEEACTCRKPLPGLWKTLAARHALDPARTIMIGDKRIDTTFAANAGLALGILVLTGKGQDEVHKTECLPTGDKSGDTQLIVVPDLLAAARWLLQRP